MTHWNINCIGCTITSGPSAHGVFSVERDIQTEISEDHPPMHLSMIFNTHRGGFFHWFVIIKHMKKPKYDKMVRLLAKIWSDYCLPLKINLPITRRGWRNVISLLLSLWTTMLLFVFHVCQWNKKQAKRQGLEYKYNINAIYTIKLSTNCCVGTTNGTTRTGDFPTISRQSKRKTTQNWSMLRAKDSFHTSR